jgi:hypothetical protein
MGDETMAATSRREEDDRDRDSIDNNNNINNINNINNNNVAFIDADSVRAAGHMYLTRRYEAERQRILARLPAAYQSRWRTVGFVQGKPVMVVGLYDVPYGPIRRLWMEALCKVCMPSRQQESGQQHTLDVR